ncbi:MAG: POTRA domain-containing protein [Flavobacteriales bacterium]
MDWNPSIGRWLSLCLFLAVLDGFAQSDTAKIIMVEVDLADSRLFKRLDGERFKARELEEAIELIETNAFREGFINYKVTEEWRGDTLILNVRTGPAYRWANISMTEDALRIMRKADVNVNRLIRKPVSPKRIGRAMNEALNLLENTGRPFAEIRLDSIQIIDHQFYATVMLEQGPFMKIDSVIVVGDLKVRETYLTNYLGIKEGGIYNEKRIKTISRNLSEVQFISESRPAQVRFQTGQTKVTLFLNSKRASRFDGIVGFLPDEKTGEILITGDASLHLENALKNGEVIDINWRKLQTNTQDLYAEVVVPFVLNSPISPDGILKIYRRDTTFTDVFSQLGLRYIFSRNNFLRAFVDRQTTSLISTSQYENTVTIPPYLDRTIISYGLGFNYAKLDYRLNPSKGVELFVEGGVGNKVILENSALPEFIYDSLSLSSLQVKSRLNTAYYLSLVPRLVWHQRYLGASLINDQLFNNEAYRIGGLKTLRGFNEESIFATSYVIARSELRYQIEKNGYVFLLFDQAWYENNSLNRIGVRRDTPYAVGVGITLGTKAGIFSLSTALGSEQGNPLLIRAAKFHFGFLSVF